MVNTKEIKQVQNNFESTLIDSKSIGLILDIFGGKISKAKVKSIDTNNFFINKLVSSFEGKKIEISSDLHLKISGNGVLEIIVKKDCSLFIESIKESFVYIKVVVEKGVDLNFVDFSNSKNLWKFIEFDLKKDSKIVNSQVVLDASSVVTNSYLKELSEYNLYNAYYFDSSTCYILNGSTHLEEKSISDLNMSGAAANNSRIICDGLVRITSDAANSEGYQTINGLLLDDKSMILSEPVLEIENNNVKCSHGCSIYQIKDDILYYMQSRGISKEESIKLVVNGFFVNACDKVINDEFKNILLSYIDY